jgi:catechol 2,3-dioxygenase-like lactoylglutathione lyase family enzyme
VADRPVTQSEDPVAPALCFTDLHHVRIPVTDAWKSRDWYMSVLGFLPVLDLEEEQGLVGVVLRHPTGLVIGLHQEPVRAAALRGFALLGLAVADRDELEALVKHLDRQGVSHGALEEGHLGWYVDVADPDQILIRLHCGAVPYAEEA